MKAKPNSLEYKIEQKKKYLQRLIDIPVDQWRDYDHWHSENKPFYINGRTIVDVVEGKVVVSKAE